MYDYSIDQEERNRKCVISVYDLYLNLLFILKEKNVIIYRIYFKIFKFYRIFIFFIALVFNKRFDVFEYGMVDLDDLLFELFVIFIVVNSVSRISLAIKVVYLINDILKKMSFC